MSAKSLKRTPVHLTMPLGSGAPHCIRKVREIRGRGSRSEKRSVPRLVPSPRVSTRIAILV